MVKGREKNADTQLIRTGTVNKNKETERQQPLPTLTHTNPRLTQHTNGVFHELQLGNAPKLPRILPSEHHNNITPL